MSADKHTPEAHANMARIVACVNTCASMDDPAAIISGLMIARDTLAIVAKQRDVLRAELLRIKDILRRDDPQDLYDGVCIALAEAQA